MALPPYLHVSQVLNSPMLTRLFDEVESNSGFPGFISYRMFGSPGSGDDQANLIAWLDKTGFGWLHDRLYSIARQLNKDYWNLEIDGFAELQFTRYLPGEGYGWHTDKSEPGGATAHRTLSMVTLLKNPTAGGGIEFRDGGHVPLEEGAGVVFPSHHIHRALPVEEGERYSLIFWMGHA